MRRQSREARGLAGSVFAATRQKRPVRRDHLGLDEAGARRSRRSSRSRLSGVKTCLWVGSRKIVSPARSSGTIIATVPPVSRDPRPLLQASSRRRRSARGCGARRRSRARRPRTCGGRRRTPGCRRRIVWPWTTPCSPTSPAASRSTPMQCVGDLAMSAADVDPAADAVRLRARAPPGWFASSTGGGRRGRSGTRPVRAPVAACRQRPVAATARASDVEPGRAREQPAGGASADHQPCQAGPERGPEARPCRAASRYLSGLAWSYWHRSGRLTTTTST